MIDGFGPAHLFQPAPNAVADTTYHISIGKLPTLTEIAQTICKSRTCEGFRCCQWPASMGRTNCPVKNGGYDDAASAVMALFQPYQTAKLNPKG